MSDIVKAYNTELYHNGVKGMKWGVRKKGFAPNSSSKRPGWQHKQSKHERDYIDKFGFNPGTPKAPKGAVNAVENSRSASIKKGAKAVGKALGAIGLTGIAAMAGAAGATYVGYKVVSKLWNAVRDASPILW